MFGEDKSELSETIKIVNNSIHKYKRFKYKKYESLSVFNAYYLFRTCSFNVSKEVFCCTKKGWRITTDMEIKPRKYLVEFVEFIQYIQREKGFETNNFQVKMCFWNGNNYIDSIYYCVLLNKEKKEVLKRNYLDIENGVSDCLIKVRSHNIEDLKLMERVTGTKGFCPFFSCANNLDMFQWSLSCWRDCKTLSQVSVKKICERLKINDIEEIVNVALTDPNAVIELQLTHVEDLSSLFSVPEV